ncbi:SDR family NAD(P)-dependent oxidoreductase [Parerythrobacter jejuensis]|uniref:SDR family NAD(P)-dependent oxidoreductase n=1 Tax=Parerythrobacter jejuensis TaxID=795812 RepID=A0A845ATX4_9SPHN|nr:SDR family NAD(P)-dependent oxidoreductase [Parerythrobacter jejuensis]MXP32485.1 SDR family NAD(P)-dependent oxidoreductase [Parerythrobacter jejuensis]
MDDVGHSVARAAVFGASGGIGAALCEALAERGCERIYAGSRSGRAFDHDAIVPFRFDYDDPESLARAARDMEAQPPQLVIVATGVLTLPDGTGPERSFKQLDADVMERVLRINTIGPAVVAKHMLPLFPRRDRAVFAALSARVGSIGDNGIGGWHSYRASKAALNMLVKNFAIELGRTHKQAIAVSLHPGTVDTELSQPFQSNLADGQLTDAREAADNLLAVIDNLTPEASGHQFDWQGKRVPD